MTGDTRDTVLVVEDDASIRELICTALVDAGVVGVPARDGEEAIDIARAKPPAAVILDIGLPGMDGTTVAQRIRDLYEEPIPFIVVTAGGRIDEASRRIGATARVGKPFDVNELVRVVQGAIAPPPKGATEAAPETANP